MGGYINYYEIILSTNKSLLQASNNFRTPLRRRLRGVTERGFKGEADEDPCGRVLGPPPWNGDSTVSRIEILNIINYYIRLTYNG